MSTKTSWRLLSLVMVVAMLLALMPGFTSAEEPAAPPAKPLQDPPPPPKTAPVPPKAPPKTVDYSAKLHPSLRELAQKTYVTLPKSVGEVAGAGPSEPILVYIIAKAEQSGTREPALFDLLQPYFVDGKAAAMPQAPKIENPYQTIIAVVLPRNLLKIASHPGVFRITPATAERREFEPYPADDPKPEVKRGPDDWAKLRENAAKLREGSLPWAQARAYGDGRERPPTEDWFEVLPEGPHKAKAAWDRGYTGEGVLVSVIDDGVDFGHPDLMGTQKIYSGTDVTDPSLPSPYNGWPYIMDPFTMRAYWQEMYFGAAAPPYVSESFGGSTYIDTSETPALTPAGSGISTFNYTPWIDFGVKGYNHTYVISDDMSISGVVHVGTHPGESLRDYIWGEKVSVLVCDPNTAGVYDTVYVDLDDDYDFRDEKPCTRADLSDLANTKNNPVSYRDMNADGKADLSGGLLYFIGDGTNYVPGMEWLYYPAALPFAPPGNGDLICLHGPWDSGYSHGTNCASNVVAQGMMTGMLPDFADLTKGDKGKPAAAVYGMAPGAGMVAMNNGWRFTGYVNDRDAYMLAAIGYDAIDQYGDHWFLGPGYTDQDTIVATSNSYGYSEQFNDGYDYTGQFIVQVQRNYGPYQQYLFSTGNGGPGYGTVAPPSPALGIAVGASTEYDSTGWDTITDTTQIMFNDIAAFSNSGPGARDGAGVDVVAGGAFAAGSEQLNYYSMGMYGILDGNVSWDDWGGTSRSSPVTLGIYALIADAYKAKHGTWPTYDQGKALLMSSATDINYDVYKQGAGSVNGDRGTLVASGDYGTYMASDSATWEPGDFRGTNYPGFGHVVYPSDTWNKTFTVHNDSASAINVNIADTYLERIGTKELTLDVTAAMVTAESAYGAENRDNFYKAFNYFIPITASAGNDASWYNVDIPSDTDLMVVRQIFPFDEFDTDGDYSWDNRFYLTVYNWKDINSNGLVWDDKDSNGVVNFINGPYLGTAGLKASPELAWDDPRTELDRWEYGRFGYNRPYANCNELCVQDPLGRMHDGLFIGLRHHPGSSYTGDTHLKYRIEFYKKADCGWLSTNVANLNVPAGGTATFQGTVNVPADMPVGDYSAAIEVFDPGPLGGTAHNTVIPVAINVAADFDDLYAGDTLAGHTAYTYDAKRNYNNGAMRGYFDWGWREESGDGRFFYLDIDNAPVETVLLSEDFGTWPLTGWTIVDNDGGGLVWQSGTVCADTNDTGGTGDFADANSDCFGASTFDTELRTPVIDLSTAGTPILEFKSAYENYANVDYARVWASGDGGTNWDLLLEWNSDQSGPQTIQLDLSAYAGSSNVVISFQYDSDGNSGWYWSWQIDDVRVVDASYPYDPNAHVIVRDVWDNPAPHNDIDTYVFGPTTSDLNAVNFGVWGGNWWDPAFFGPYTLDTVGNSADDRAGRSVWRFNTSSGKNEDWVTFPIQDGLHEIFQHNILYEGTKFDMVFTKTLGLLTEDVHAFDIQTYDDKGTVGQVTVQCSMDLNGLTAKGFGLGGPEHFINEPIDFISSSTIEWTNTFSVSNGLKIDLTTSSPDIPDIDLYLFHWDGATWQQMGASTSADADEHIQYMDPADGNWMVGINNWSGPAGHFNLTRVVVEGTSLSVTGGSTDPVPAGTPVVFTVNYDHQMTPGDTYEGMVVLGPPEAPNLKQVPVSVTRLPNTASLDKKVSSEVFFPGSNLKYTINLYNLVEAGANFEFTDPIPDNTTFVSVDNATYNAVDNRIEYSGTLPLGGPAPNDEGFESGVVPPSGWTHVQNNVNETWYSTNASAHSGSYSAQCDYDAALNQQDEWLISPYISGLTGGENVTAWSMGSYYWAVDPEDNYDINAWLVVDDLGGGDDVLLGKCDDDWTANWTWAQSTFTLPTTLPTGDLRVGFQYYGVDGAQANIDDIHLPGTLASLPSRTVEVTVKVSDTVTADTITNTGTLKATRFSPIAGKEEVSAYAVSHRATDPSFSTSYKEAPTTTVTGGNIVYQVHVKNTGDTLTNITFTDPIPAGTLYSSHVSPPPSYFEYNAVDNQMEWTGHVGPGEEVVLIYTVYVEGSSLGETITNTATITWNGNTMDLTASTYVEGAYKFYFPLATKDYTP